MVWTPTQRTRLAIEKERLEKYFLLGITWIDPQHETKVEVLFKSNSDKEYKLRIYIPDDFPNSCPVLVVVSPPKLILKNGSRLPEISDSFHTLEDTHGFHRICHFYPPDWTEDITLYQVFMKGRLWIEAYEAHLDTGKNMDAFLGEQKFTVAPRQPLYESDSISDCDVSDLDYDGDDSDGYLEFSRRLNLTEQLPSPVNDMTSPFPHLSDQTLPTTGSCFQLPSFATMPQPRLRDVFNETSALDLPHEPSNTSEVPAQSSLPPIENRNHPFSQQSQLPFSPILHQAAQRRVSNEISNSFTDRNNNNTITTSNNNTITTSNKEPTLSSPPFNHVPPQQISQQPLGSIVNPSPLRRDSSETSTVNQHLPNDQTNNPEVPAQTPNNDAPSPRNRPAGAVDVLLPFLEEMRRRNSSSSQSRVRPTVVPPPVKPKPKRPR